MWVTSLFDFLSPCHEHTNVAVPAPRKDHQGYKDISSLNLFHTVKLEGNGDLSALGGSQVLDDFEALSNSLGMDILGPPPGELNSLMEAPPHAVYSSLEELLSQATTFALARGYKLVVVRSKTNNVGQKIWVHLACDRHGVKRNTHGLTPETRKKNRRSRRCECPMHCAAMKTTSDLWELAVKNPEHNHGPYVPPPKKKKDLVPPPPSESVNLPLLATPSACIADFCLVPIGTGSPSVSAEIAEVQRLLKRSGLVFSMSSAGTTVEGTWDDVMRIIGQAHSLLHGSGVVRIQTDIRVGSRTDKKQTIEDKIAVVQALLNGQEEEIISDGEDLTLDDPTASQLQNAMSNMHTNMNNGIHNGMMAQSHSGYAAQSTNMHNLAQNFNPTMTTHMQHMHNGMG